MGLAQSALTPVANLVLQWSGFPLLFAYWWYNRRFLSSWMTVVFLFAYQLTVILGGNITNPLSFYIPGSQDYFDANLIFCSVLPAIAIGFALMGSGWALFLDSAELFPIGALIPASYYNTPYTFVVRESDGSYLVNEARTVAVDPPRWGVSKLRPTWAHFLLSLLAFLCAVAVPQILYTWYIAIAGSELLAWMLNLWIPVAVYILYGMWCYFVGDAYVFGLNERYFRQNKAMFTSLSLKQKKEITTETNSRVFRTIVPLALVQFLTSLVLGGTRFITADVDNNWLTAVGYFAFLLLVLIILALVMRSRRNRQVREAEEEEDESRTREKCEGEDYYDRQPLTPPSDAGVDRRYGHRSALAQVFADDS